MTISRRALGLSLGLIGSTLVASAAVGCGGDDGSVLIGTSSGASGSGEASSSGASSGSGSGSSSSGAGGGGTTSSSSSSSGSSSSGAGGGQVAVADPNMDGPYQYKEFDDSTKVAASGNTVPIHCAYPTAGPEAGPYPVVVIAHGMQLPANLYLSYVKRLASFGYVALTADFPASLINVDNTKNAKDLSGALDWAAANATLAGKVDVNKAGMTGHSLGGKLALLTSTMDARVKASITLDPVDGGGFGGCNPPACIDVSALMPSLAKPTGFLGETLDSMAGMFGMACAPVAENYTTFYAGATSPSFEVTVKGASHMSFLDDPNCGFTCSACQMETAPPGSVNAMARAYVVAFYERYLRGNVAYESYLTGAEAQARYVSTGAATIKSK